MCTTLYAPAQVGNMARGVLFWIIFECAEVFGGVLVAGRAAALVLLLLLGACAETCAHGVYYLYSARYLAVNMSDT
jgi:hypothetical protein